METKYTDEGYDGGTSHDMEDGYDYMLFRQDFNGTERVYFNQDEVDEVLERIQNGFILIQANYSILYTSSEELVGLAPELGCFVTVKQS